MINKSITFGILLVMFFSFVVAYAEFPVSKMFLNDHVKINDKSTKNTDAKSADLVTVSDGIKITIHRG